MKKAIIFISIFLLLGFILKLLLYKNPTISSGLRSACTCYDQGYNSGLRGGQKYLYGCYKGNDNGLNIRKAWNEGYWYGQKTADGIKVDQEYYARKKQYCN